MKHRIKNLDESILMTASMAIGAYRQGTFSVSGILLDKAGNLLLCLPGAQNISTIRTAFLETTRTYAGIRYRLSQELRHDIFQYLGHPKQGTFIFALGTR